MSRAASPHWALTDDARVALVLPPGVEASIALLGAMVAAVAAPLNPGSTSDELTRDLQRLAPRLVVRAVLRGTVRASPPPWGLPR